jgi:hypothetical protein
MDGEIITPITVGVVLHLNFHGTMEQFNEEDVLTLAREGVETHYDVEHAVVNSWERKERKEEDETN